MQIESKLTDKEWVSLTKIMVEYVNGGLRLGQSYMNALALVRMDLYDEIIATDCDPFYVDIKIIKFINYLNNQIELKKPLN